MTELFMKLLNMSINAGWLVLTVLLVRIIFRKAPKWLFPVLWSFVGINIFDPFTPSFIVPIVILLVVSGIAMLVYNALSE